MPDTEIGFNLVPQYTNFTVRFGSITKDGSALSFSTVGHWVFTAAPSTSTYPPTITKWSTGVASGDFTINGSTRNVDVLLRASELSNMYGTLYVNLYAVTSGNPISHTSKYITIQKQVRPSGGF